MKRNNFAIFVVCLMVTILSGCASVKTAPEVGFLSNYEGLSPSEVYEGMYVEKHPSKTLADYQKFILTPVVVYLHEDSKGNAIDPAKLSELTSFFNEELERQLSEKYKIVQEPEEGALLIRMALTDIIPSKPLLNIHWSTKLSNMGTGGASLEAEFVDSLSGELILAVKDSREGRSLGFDKDGMWENTKGALKHYSEGLSKYGNVKDVFVQWITMLTHSIEQGY